MSNDWTCRFWIRGFRFQSASTPDSTLTGDHLPLQTLRLAAGGGLTYALATPIQNQGCEAARRLTLAECEPDELNTLLLLLCTLATTSLIHVTVTLLFWCFPLRRDRKCVTFPAESATLKVSEELECEAIWQRDDCSSVYCFLLVIMV